MKHRLILPGIIALLLFIAACSPPPPLRDDTLLQDSSLLSDSPECLIPCWRGITPGVTAWDDALARLEADTTLENINVKEDEESSAKAADFQQVGGASCCEVISNDGESVSVIFLRVAPNVTLGQLIEAQGEPTYLVGSEYTDDQAVINLIYPEELTVVYAFVPGTSGSLSTGSEIVGILYLTPPDMDLLIKTAGFHAWDGYKAYQDYNSSEFEVTPSVTLTPTPDGG